MSRPQEKLAAALSALKNLQDQGRHAISGTDLARADREALRRAGFLQQVIRGWYLPVRPGDAPGGTAAWYAGMREFIAAYSNQRFGAAWHVNPEQSLLLRSGDRTLPRQLQIWAVAGTNQTVTLLHGCSLFIYRAPKLLAASAVADCGGLRLAETAAALAAAGPAHFQRAPLAVQIALASLPDASDLLRVLLEGDQPAAAARLAGALRAGGRNALADEILGAMRGAGYVMTETNPFDQPLAAVLPAGRPESPYVQRLRLMWAAMRLPVMAAFPALPKRRINVVALMREIDARYVADAYHSLSIEGYRVSAALIEKVRQGNWNPSGSPQDRAVQDAMAARGYFEAHNAVKDDAARILKGENPGAVLRAGLPRWYQALFSPSVQAGLLQPIDLAGYRNDQVYIRGALHVPLPKEAVRECMPVLFDLLEAEPSPQVRAVLGHFVFVYIHPYMDGNGRLGRFLMNLMLAAGGAGWVVVPVQRRDEYMQALEQASSFGDIGPFSRFIAKLARAQLAKPPHASGQAMELA